MNDAGNDWDRWYEATGFRRRVVELADKYRADTITAPEAYLAHRRAELARELENRKLIYLDTKHWVNLCHVAVQSPQLLPIYDEILGLLELMRQRGRIFCPVSSSVFMELMKQTDRATRLASARIMDYLSGGVCVRYWLELVQFEFVKHVHRTLRSGDVDEAMFPTWTKAGYWAGEHTVEFPGLPNEDSALMEKVYTDLRWNMTFAEYQDMPDWVPAPDGFADAWVNEVITAKVNQAKLKPTFNNLVRQRRNQLLSALIDQLVPMLPALCSGLSGSSDDHIAAVLDPIYEGRDPNAMPSVEIVAGLDAAISLESTRKVQANDMLDYLHAAQALPYCDALFCDNFMAQKMRNRPLEFGKIYDTEIGSRPEEIVRYLKGLT